MTHPEISATPSTEPVRLEPSEPRELELPNFLGEMGSNSENRQMTPPDRPPLEPLPPTEQGSPPSEGIPPPEEPSQAAINAWIGLQLEQAFERIITLEKAVSAVIHTNESPPSPPSIESVEQALLFEVDRYDRGELTNQEYAILIDQLSGLATELQKRA